MASSPRTTADILGAAGSFALLVARCSKYRGTVIGLRRAEPTDGGSSPVTNTRSSALCLLLNTAATESVSTVIDGSPTEVTDSIS